MPAEPTEDDIESAIASVTHPEIDASLQQLGMVDELTVEGSTATVTLALPMLNIPDQVKNILVSRLREAVEGTGAEFESEITVMSAAQRERFFELEESHWSGGLEDVDGPEGGTETSDPPF